MSQFSRFATVAAVLASTFAASTVHADDRVLLFSAYPAEQAVLLSHLQPQPPVEVGVFNGRRFFSGTIAGKNFVMGLVGIGLVNADRTSAEAIEFLESHGATIKGILFSGVAGGPHIGDVIVPGSWSDGSPDPYPADQSMLAVAQGLEVTLNSFLPIEDATCTGLRLGNTPIELTVQPELIVAPDRFGASSDPYGDRAVPCLSHAGSLLGCEACGAPLNTSPGIEKFVSEAQPFLGPDFFIGLFSSFSGGPSGAIVGDMETSAVAKNAQLHGIPFLGFRAVSDGGGDPNPVTAAVGFPVQFAVYQQLAADNAAAVVLEFLDQWTP